MGTALSSRIGRDVAFTPYEPRGLESFAPAHSLFATYRRPLVLITVDAPRAWRLAIWDRFTLIRSFCARTIGTRIPSRGSPDARAAARRPPWQQRSRSAPPFLTRESRGMQ